MSPLETERRFFAAHQGEWRAAHPDKFVLVKGEKLIGTFNRPEDALSEGARLFSEEPFLVRHVDQVESDVFIPALALGLLRPLHAGSPHTI